MASIKLNAIILKAHILLRSMYKSKSANEHKLIKDGNTTSEKAKNGASGPLNLINLVVGALYFSRKPFEIDVAHQLPGNIEYFQLSVPEVIFSSRPCLLVCGPLTNLKL